MGSSTDRNIRSRTAYCPRCKEEFLTYNTVASTECPFCGRTVRPVGQKRLLGIGFLLLVVAAVAAGVFFFWLKR